MPEFQPKTVASFNKHQIEQVFIWAHQNGVTEANKRGERLIDALEHAIETAQNDEKGKLMDERGRERLRQARRVFVTMGRYMEEFKQLQGEVAVVQINPDPSDVEIRWKIPDTRVEFKGRLFERRSRYYS